MSSYNKITKTDLADGALYEKVNDMVDTLNADKIERGQVGIRKGSTAYKVGDKCFCEYHGDFLLECTTAGTSAVGQLDTSGTVTDGATRTDGSVVWTFRSVATKKELNDVKNSSLNKTQITNCITEIPQDIKLELNNGTLTLKAGSKVYDGSGNVINITNDKSLSSITSSTRRSGVMVFYDTQNKSLYYFNDAQMFSGATQPTSSEIGQYAVWYDTTNKVLKRTTDDGATWISGVSLPLGSFTVENNTILSLDQIFNGFGYIGSTVYALPGVKALVPNGRNADGTLKNTEFTITRVLPSTFGGTYTGSFYSYWNGTRNIFQAINYYDVKTNTMGSYNGFMQAGIGYLEGNRVTSFTPKTPFHAVDYYDFAATEKALQTSIGTKQNIIQDLATIRSGASKGATAVQPGGLAKVATSGSYNDLNNKPTIPTTPSQVGALPNTTKYGSGLSYTDDTLKLLDQDGKALGSSIEIKASGGGRNVGDIFYTTRTDTSLNGAFECNGGRYATSFYSGSGSIVELLNAKKVPYVSMSEYENLVSTNGYCRAFGWDGGEMFRVPTIPALVLTKTQASVAVRGNGKTLGLTNGSSNYGLRCGGNGYQISQTGLYNVNVGTASSGSNVTGATGVGVTTNSNASGLVGTANLNVVQYRAMVQLANEATDEALITATSALQQISNLDANKANTSASNFNATGKSTIVGWGCPAYGSAVSVSNSGSYTAPSNGWIFLTVTGGGNETSVSIGSVQVGYGWWTNTGVGARVNVPMSKGDVITWDTGRITGTIQFVKRKGG